MDPATITATAAPEGTILSGQLVSKVWDTDHYEFVVGNAAGVTPYIAWSDSADQDVVESGKMTGLSCAGTFEIQTAFFKTGETYNEGTLLTWDGTTGDVKPAAATDPIIGAVTKIHGAVQKLDPANSLWESSVTTPANSAVIVFATSYNGAVAP